MSNEWHLAINREQSGPHTAEALRALLRDVDLEMADVKVWRRSMAEWVDPRTIEGLLTEAPTTGSSPEPPAMPEASDFNPYAPPSTVEVRNVTTGEVGNHPLDVMEAFSVGWGRAKTHLGPLVLFGLLMYGITFVVAIPFQVAVMLVAEQSGEASPAYLLLAAVSQIVQSLLSVYLGLGAMRYALNHIRRNNPLVSDLFSGGPMFLNGVGASVLYLLIVIAGFVCLIIPGIYLAIRLSPYQALVADRNLSPVDALKTSWEVTRGNVLNLIGFWLMSIVIVLAGLLALVIGLIWALPTVFLAWAAAYQMMAYGAASLRS